MRNALICLRTLLTTAGVVGVTGSIVFGALGPPRLRAQSPAVSAFEVASVKPNRSGGPARPIATQGGRLTIVNLPLREIIRAAYQVADYQLLGGPDWIRSTRFDVTAKAEQNLPPFPPPPAFNAPNHPALPMLRALLAERFKLVVHHESRTLPIFALELARPGGPLGPQLERSAVDCTAVLAARSVAQQAGSAAAAPRPGQASVCGVVGSPGRLAADSQSMSQLVEILSGWAGRTVVDRTGLTGLFTFTLEFAAEQTPSSPQTDPAGAEPRPSFFTAVREQLGLKLESTKGPLDVLVIDHAEQPTPD
jgi:uncharacterized protein (TIGR03435 family)